jgi:threonine/homoserine/homoserine lactone efflux protein
MIKWFASRTRRIVGRVKGFMNRRRDILLILLGMVLSTFTSFVPDTVKSLSGLSLPFTIIGSIASVVGFIFLLWLGTKFYNEIGVIEKQAKAEEKRREARQLNKIIKAIKEKQNEHKTS